MRWFPWSWWAMREDPVEVEQFEKPGTGLVEGKDDAAFLGAFSKAFHVCISDGHMFCTFSVSGVRCLARGGNDSPLLKGRDFFGRRGPVRDRPA
jgi:hypothetical protein